MGATGTSPCASCKLLRRRCAKDCIFAPYFPADDPHKFALVHKVFGASNVSKMLQELEVCHRGDAVSSLVYEANARVRDPVYGCVGAISYLQGQLSQLRMELAVAQAEILCMQMQSEPVVPMSSLAVDAQYRDHQRPFLLQNHQQYHDVSRDQYLNFTSPSSASSVIHDYVKRESIFGHDMVS